MHPHIPARDFWWLAAGSASYGARYMRLKVRVARTARRTPDPTGGLLRLQTLYGYNAHSLVSVAPGARLWSSPEIDGAIIYGEFGRVWLAAGDPLARPEDAAELARQFVAAAKRRRRIAAFIPATERFARLAVAGGMCAVKVGAAPYFDLKTWEPRGDRAKKMRAGINQAGRAGIKVEVVTEVGDELRRETAALCRTWLRTRRAASGFSWLLALDPFRHAAHKKFYAARDSGGRLVGLLAASVIPARDGWYLEDVLRLPDAPPGTADLLVVEVLRRLRDEGASLATLGTSPLAPDGADDISTRGHSPTRRALRLVGARMGTFYNFAGVRRFKAKFAPSFWESEYVLVPRGASIPPRVAYAFVRAVVPGGIVQLLARQVTRATRRGGEKGAR
ncbi:MAG: phosphatidylglycerol lysyltransferase domain-containing protein [Pyrinomonadaceae bacterium]